MRELRLEDEVIFTGYLTVEELVSLYNGADAFVFPSLYEGFGLPVLEAMACGCPVVVSNTTSLPEVVDDAGLMVDDPFSADKFADQVLRLLSDSELRDSLIKKGFERAKKFKWEKMAKETIGVIENIYKSSRD